MVKNISRQAYFKDPRLSQSTLKGLMNKKQEVKSVLGTLVDDMATSPADLDDYIKTDIKVSPKIKDVLDRIYLAKLPLNKQSILKHIGDYGGTTYTATTKVKHVMAYEEYFNLMLGGKKIVTNDEWDLAEQMVNVLHTHPLTQYLKDGVNQVAKFSEINGVQVKCLLDYDFGDEFTDLKFVYSMKEARASFWKYRYDFQAAWYQETTGYKKLPKYVFIAPDADYPLVLQVSQPTLDMGKYGGMVYTETYETNNQIWPVGYYRYGFLDLMREYERLTNAQSFYPHDFEQITKGYTTI